MRPEAQDAGILKQDPGPETSLSVEFSSLDWQQALKSATRQSAFEPPALQIDNLFSQSQGDKTLLASAAPPVPGGKFEVDYLDVAKLLGKGQKPGEKPVKESTTTLDWRKDKLTLTTRDGVSVFFKSADGEWDSKDGKTWIRRGSNDRDIWHGTIEQDDKGNVVERGTASGATRVYGKDGSETKTIMTDSGQKITLTVKANGEQQFVGKKTWTSRDGGNTWTDTDGNTARTTMSIDGLGRVRRYDTATGVTDFPYRSKENAEINNKMAQLVTKYGISFGEAQQSYEYAYTDANTDTTRRVETKLRLPTLDQLKTLENVLSKYSHLDVRGMRFNFISGSGEGSKVSEWGWYHSSKDGIPQIYFGPSNLRDSNGWDAFEGTALHEIAHHLQSKRFTGKNGKDVPKKMLDFFGADYNADQSPNRLKDSKGSVWESASTRIKDKDGNHYYSTRWYPVVDGKINKDLSKARTSQQMHDSMPADKRPCTKYFTNTWEAHAEALAMLLQNPKMLYERNRNLYTAAREWDQDDINARHGYKVDARNRPLVDGNGKPVPNMIRGAGGGVVDNNDANRDAVKKMEREWRNESASSGIDWKENNDWRQACPCCFSA